MISILRNFYSKWRQFLWNYFTFFYKKPKIVLNSSNKILVESLMRSRAEVVAFDVDISYEELKRFILNNAFYSKILVFKKNMDNVLGFISIYDVIHLLFQPKKYSISKYLKRAIITNNLVSCQDLLQDMLVQNIYFAIVINEYGSFDGIITITDILYDKLDLKVERKNPLLNNVNYLKLKKGVIVANARVPLSKIEKELSINLDNKENHVNTIGGLVISKVGRIPAKGSIVKINPHVNIEVLDSDLMNLKQVKITSSERAF